MAAVFTEAGRTKAEQTGALTGPSVLDQFNWDRRMIELGQMDGWMDSFGTGGWTDCWVLLSANHPEGKLTVS